MNQKIKGFISRIYYFGIKNTPYVTLETKERILKKYFGFIETTFKIITGIIISLTFLWFFPTKLNMGWTKTIAILLVTILLQLRYSKIQVIAKSI